MIQDKTISYYHQKASEVLQYINNNIGSDLNIRYLAERFHISFYHFHRIMRAFLDEPLGEYINRVRLETAVSLLKYSSEPLTSIAGNIGYADLSSFSKAFSREFGISPTEFRNDQSLVLNTHIDYRMNSDRKIIVQLKPKIITLPDKKVCYIHVTGKYGSDEVQKAWDELEEFSKRYKLPGWRPEFFAIYYDDPDVVDPDLCSSDVCIATKKDLKEEGRIKFKTIKGEKCMVFRYKGPYEQLWDIYDYIYKDWIIKTDHTLRDLPTFEKYLNFSPQTKPENLLTEIYIPIE